MSAFLAHLLQTRWQEDRTHSSRRDSIPIAQPDHSRPFDTGMRIRCPHRLCTSSRVEQPQLLIPACLVTPDQLLSFVRHEDSMLTVASNVPTEFQHKL